MKKNIVISGAGRLGGALAIALKKSGYGVKALITKKSVLSAKFRRNFDRETQFLKFADLKNLPDCDIVFITVPDTEIGTASAKIAEFETVFERKPTVFHTGGALSSEVLENLQKKGCAVGSFHPLISVSDAVLGAESFAGAFFCLEGEKVACETAKEIVKELGGQCFTVETKFKPLYHAAAVTACGHLVALFDAACEMLEKCGLDREEGGEILLPLVKSTVENLQKQTPVNALTGTFARADVPTMEKHLLTINAETTPEISEIYKTLGLRSLKLAQKQGANAENLQKMKVILEKNGL